ncbi:hypothetical protein K504DRAFT_261648 [Pleomassaria siparia CBS 279.74]|uniref:Uncharacterized protein n=1 Tax=Pleomassaria siparia CBS 279.74 TaxID=1314801 RepID=A0A6G1KC83_9PLEO|nr:hypothetical protein K504DRAFT_261648 [Pleomassaria siparia CBS 279.74]
MPGKIRSSFNAVPTHPIPSTIMASGSEDWASEYDRFDARIRHNAREHSPVSRPQEAVHADDLLHFGGRFAEGENGAKYPTQLDLSEDEDAVRQPRSPRPPSQTSLHPTDGRNESPFLASQGGFPSFSTPITPPMRRVFVPYLQPEGLQDLHVPRTHSSGQRTIGSSYFSVRASPASLSSVPTTQNENNSDGNENDDEHYFAPSHTPSHCSVSTEEEVAVKRAPEPPHPYSNYNLYDDRYGRDVVEGFKQH